jgi:cardiolipin synthase
VKSRWQHTYIKHRKAVFWIVFSFGLVGLLIFLAQDPATLRVESQVAATDPRFPDYVASLLGTPVHVGDEYTVLHNGDEFYPALLDAINNAKHRISFESYVYKDGEIGDKVVQALAAAAKRGVTVRIVLDPIGAKMGSKNEELLKESGAQLSWFNPIGFFTFDHTNYRTHRKTFVIDGDLAFTGGMGISDSWSGHAQDKEHWRDTQFKITGPSVRALEGSFYENWIETGGRSRPALDPEMAPRPTGAHSVVAWSNSVSGVSNVKLMFLLSIGAARKNIDIQSPYVTTDPTIRWSLAEARKRGVRIRLLTEGTVTDAMPVKHASRRSYQTFLDEGIEIAEYQPTMMHAKVFMVDGAFSIIGSANFGNRSFELNDELTIGILDRDLTAALTRDFETDWKSTMVLTKESWPHQRSLDGKINEWFWSFFGEFF